LNNNIKIEEKRIASIDSVFEINNKDSIVKYLNQYDTLVKKFDSFIKLCNNKRYIFKGDDINYQNDTLLLYNYLETMKNQKEVILSFYDNTSSRFSGWQVKYDYNAKDTSINYNQSCWDTFLINPEFNRIISFKSNDRKQDLNIRRKVNLVKSGITRRQLRYAWFIEDLPITE
jgi:hypothetical protein